MQIGAATGLVASGPVLSQLGVGAGPTPVQRVAVAVAGTALGLLLHVATSPSGEPAAGNKMLHEIKNP